MDFFDKFIQIGCSLKYFILLQSNNLKMSWISISEPEQVKPFQGHEAFEMHHKYLNQLPR